MTLALPVQQCFNIGYPIEYDKELQVYYVDFPELLRA